MGPPKPPAAPAPAEGVVSCPHGQACGACAHLDRPAADELRAKRDAVERALLAHRALRSVEVEDCLPSPRIAGYRSRAKLVVRGGRAVGLGHYGARSRRFVDVPECRVLEPALVETAAELRTFLARHPGLVARLRFVDLRCGSDPERQHATLVLDADRAPPRLPCKELAGACRRVKGVSYNLNPGRGGQVIRGAVEHAHGERSVRVDVGGAWLRVSPGAFFQVNLHVLPAIHDRMRRHLAGVRLLYDLYAGVGTHGVALRRDAAEVVCVEGVTAAVRDARGAALEAGIANVRVLGGAVERHLRRLAQEGPDGIVVNPSRPGMSQEVLRAVAAAGPARMAYLSCEPATLARDLAFLVDAGLRVTSVLPVNMMPQTAQVEALALLEAVRPGRTGARRRAP